MAAGIKRYRRRRRSDHRRVFRSQPTGRPARPSDETSDVRWACADELAADITTEVLGARQPFAVTTASTVLQRRDILRTRTFGPNSWALRVTDPRRHADDAPGR